MDGFLSVLLLTTLPAFGNFLGGVLAEIFNVSQRVLSLALHAAAGIVLAVVGIELIPESFRAEPAWIVILAFVGGGLFFLAVDILIERIAERSSGDPSNEGPGIVSPVLQKAGNAPAQNSGGERNAGPWAIYFGVAVDLFSDGVAIGTGSTIELGLGLLLALGQVPGDIPEGFAAIATFKEQGLSRRTRLLLAASFAVPIVLGATIGYWAVRGQAEIFKLALLAFVAGVLLTVAVEEIVPEAHREADARLATVFFVGGFALFALLSAYLG